jgi:hypothetical protein
MTAYSINYDLKAPGRNYQDLYAEIKKSQLWWHYLESTWIIVTNETPDQVWARLAPKIDKNDYLMIIEVRNRCQGWLPKDAWEWIHTNVSPP